MSKAGRGLTNKNVWHTILPSTRLREVEANPIIMKGPNFEHLKMRAVGFQKSRGSFYFIFLVKDGARFLILAFFMNLFL